MAEVDLIFCAGNNPKVAEIALGHGFKYGCRLPCDKPHFPVYFADQDWRNPQREPYIAALRQHQPALATVLDWEREEQLAEVLGWAEDAAPYCGKVIVIPKVAATERIPQRIGGKTVVLGYSVPTSYGATSVPLHQFAGRELHLLGGSPENQLRLFRYFSTNARVVSVDGNSHLKLANRGLFWAGIGRRWSLKQADGVRFEGNGNWEAFRRSCLNLSHAWTKATAT